MIIYSDTFDFRQSNAYAILSQVWEYSAKKHNPNATVILHKMAAPDTHGVPKRCMIANTVKIEDWFNIMHKYPDENIVFMDCDMLVIKDLAPVFDRSFDVAVTKHSRGNLPYNGGVVFVKGNDNAKKIMQMWVDINRKMFENRVYHFKYIKKYAGMNQAAFGALITEYKDRFSFYPNQNKPHIFELPCSIYNLCRHYWQDLNQESNIIHIKSELRNACLYDKPTNETMSCYKLWKQYAEEAGIKPVTIIDYPKKKAKVSKETKQRRQVYKNLYYYKGGYSEYQLTQINATKGKAPRCGSWAIEDNIKYLSSVLKQLIKKINHGICHGSRNGSEIAWFIKYLKCNVIGSEICPDLAGVKNTVIWDFNKENRDWINKFDFIYTNSFDHVYNPEDALKVWLGQLKEHGRLIIEYTKQHEVTKPTAVDPFKFSRADLINFVRDWTKGFCVYQFLETPRKKSIAKKPQPVEYAIIERIGLR